MILHLGRAAVLAVLAAGPLAGPAAAQATAEAPGGLIRVLDKLAGKVTDLDLSRGQGATVGRLTVQMDDCRYPADNPASDAFAHLTITDGLQGGAVFSGWMVASSPALSAMDSARYDVWVLSCDIPDGSVPEVSDSPGDDATDEDFGE